MPEPRWEPVELDLEISATAWDQAVAEVERWNAARFRGAAWVDLSDEEALLALAHYGFKPLVRGLWKQGTGGSTKMAIHLSPRRVSQPSKISVEVLVGELLVKEERIALTISDRSASTILFGLAEKVPASLERAAREPLERARLLASEALRRAGLVDP